MLKQFLLSAANTATFARFVGFLEQRQKHQSNLLRVLAYNRVDYPGARPDLDPSMISATPPLFQQQMRYLASNYHIVSMNEVLEAHRTGVPLPPNSATITFDDAYADFCSNAWPILKRLGLPVTVFVPTAFPDQPDRAFWWDRLYRAVMRARYRDPFEGPHGLLPIHTEEERQRTFQTLKADLAKMPFAEAMEWVDWAEFELNPPPTRPSVMGWETLKRLAHDGVTLGAHGRTHTPITHLTPEEAEVEIVGSQIDLERQTGQPPQVFAYPEGAHDEMLMRALRLAGFKLAFTRRPGIDDLEHANPFRVRRIGVDKSATLTLIRAQLVPWGRYWAPGLRA